MSDYGRYGEQTSNRDRDRNRGRFGGEGGQSRNSDSMFNYGSSRDRNDRGDDEMGGWAGSGRTSAYDRDQNRDKDRHQSGRWTSERENFSWGGRKEKGRDDHDRHSGGGRTMGGGGGRDREMSRGGQNERHYGSDDSRSGLPVDETSRLIASNKVEGTAVYGSDGARLGSIYNFMVNKYSGKVEYAVMSYGGFLGMGQRYYPLPWRTLTYDTNEGGYHVEMMERDLRDAPSFDRDTEPQFDRNYGERVHGWYGLEY